MRLAFFSGVVCFSTYSEESRYRNRVLVWKFIWVLSSVVAKRILLESIVLNSLGHLSYLVAIALAILPMLRVVSGALHLQVPLFVVVVVRNHF